ncbi:unnamed protein product [Cylicocyclus nassatus]|uniref:Uncharacterized protein n=1 Tax=Cylicocyclus nassatus TaxID=53992 RepID=A0AA36GJA5_CYLNA|nr:unnamed protein product [Cylicocyclus nassatus]
MAQIFYFALILVVFGKAMSQKPEYFKGDCNALKRDKKGIRARLENEISNVVPIRYNCYVEKLARKDVANVLSTNPYKYQRGNLILDGLLLYTEWPFSEKVLIKTVRQFAKKLHKVSCQR